MSNAGNSGVSGARMAVVFQRSRWKDALCQPSKTVPSSRGIQQLAFVAVALLCLDLRLAGQVSASEVPVEAGLLRAIRWAEGGVQPSITLLNGTKWNGDVWHHVLVEYSSSDYLRHAAYLEHQVQARSTMQWTIQIPCVRGGKLTHSPENYTVAADEIRQIWLYNEQELDEDGQDVLFVDMQHNPVFSRLELRGEVGEITPPLATRRDGNYTCQLINELTGEILSNQTTWLRLFNIQPRNLTQEGDSQSPGGGSMLPPEMEGELFALASPDLQNITVSSAVVEWHVKSASSHPGLQLEITWLQIPEGVDIPAENGNQVQQVMIPIEFVQNWSNGSFLLANLISGAKYSATYKYLLGDVVLSRGFNTFRTDKKPQVTCDVQRIEVNLQDDITVRCNITGHPTPSNTISAYGATIRYNDNGQLTTVVLTFKNMSSAWIGTKTVTAENRVGSQAVTFKLNSKIKSCNPIFYVGLGILRADLSERSDNHTKPGARVILTCHKGYLQFGGDKERICQTNGEWSGEALSCLKSEPTRVLIDQPPILRLIPNQKHPEIKCKTDGGVPEPTRLEWVIKYGDKMHNNWKFRGRKRNASRFSCRPWEECTLRPTKALVSNDVITCEAENKVIAINGTHETHNVNRSVQIKIVGRYGYVDDTVEIGEGKTEELSCQRADKWEDRKRGVFWVYVPRELLESWKGRTKPDVDFLQSADRMKDPLVLANSTVLHSGYYGCIAVDKSVLLQTVQVVVQELRVTKPIEPNPTHWAEFGEQVVLTCNIVGATNVSWHIHGAKVLQLSKTKSRVIVSKELEQGNSILATNLTILQMEGDLEGIYTCRGSNGYVSTSKSYVLKGRGDGFCSQFPVGSHPRCHALFQGFTGFTPMSGDLSSFFLTALEEFHSKGFHLSDSCQYEVDNVDRFLCRAAYPDCQVGPKSRQDQSWPLQHCDNDCTVLENGPCRSEWLALKQRIHRFSANTNSVGICDQFRIIQKQRHPYWNNDSYDCVTTRRDTVPLTKQENCYCDTGKLYSGSVNTSSNGAQCLPWNGWKKKLFSYQAGQFGGNFCRNPGPVSGSPWCFTLNASNPISKCQVDKCSNDISIQCRDSSWLKTSLSICADLPIYGAFRVKPVLPEKVGPEKLNASMYTILQRNLTWSHTCYHHLKQLLCLVFAQVCSREANGHCGSSHVPCPSYFKTFEAKCGSLHVLRELHKEDAVISKLISDLIILGKAPTRNEHPECIRLPVEVQDSKTIDDFSTADCLQSENDTKGETYRGTLSQTISGLECQPWTATYPHIPSPVFLLGLVPHLTGNRCRNPFGMRPKPWCYTTDPRQRWEVCDVKVCSSDSSRDTLLAVSIGCFSFLLILLIIVFYILHLRRVRDKDRWREGIKKDETHPHHGNLLPRRRQSFDGGDRRSKPTPWDIIGEMKDNPDYTPSPLALCGIHQLEHPQLSFQAKIAEGNFGTVWRANASNLDGEKETIVAVKTLKGDCNKKMEDGFLREAQIISRFKHINIIRLLGVCVPDVKHGNPLCLVFEYMEYGDLLHFLKEAQRRRAPAVDIKGRALPQNVIAHYNQEKNTVSTILDAQSHSSSSSPSSICLDSKDLCQLAAQIAFGMYFLSSRRYLHRDLAARNCLVGRNHVVKIADFGLSRDIHNRDYYKPESKWAQLPVRWMPPEVINYGKHSSQSDVWSFGVVLWEIFTFGGSPYYEYSNEEVVERVCRKGKRLPQPYDCPPDIYKMMMECWEHDPDERPQFRPLWKILKAWQPPRASQSTMTDEGESDRTENRASDSEAELEMQEQDEEDGMREDEVFDSGESFLYVTSPHGNIVPVQDYANVPATSPASSIQKNSQRKPLKSDSGVHVGNSESAVESPMSEDLNFTDESLSESTVVRSASRVQGHYRRNSKLGKKPQHQLSTSSTSLGPCSPPQTRLSVMSGDGCFLERRSAADGAPESHQTVIDPRARQANSPELLQQSNQATNVPLKSVDSADVIVSHDVPVVMGEA